MTYFRTFCLLSFPRFWTLSIERFWFLFWSTLKTSNRWGDISTVLLWWLHTNSSKTGLDRKVYDTILGKPVSFVFLESWCSPWPRLGKHQDSRENKTVCFPRDLTLSVKYNMTWRKTKLHREEKCKFKLLKLWDWFACSERKRRKKPPCQNSGC